MTEAFEVRQGARGVQPGTGAVTYLTENRRRPGTDYPPPPHTVLMPDIRRAATVGWRFPLRLLAAACALASCQDPTEPAVVVTADAESLAPGDRWRTALPALTTPLGDPAFAVAGARVIVGDPASGQIVALDATTGQILWQVRQPRYVSLAVRADGDLLVSGDSTWVRRAADGTTRVAAPARSGVQLFPGGLAGIRLGLNEVSAFDPATARETPAGTPLPPAPADVVASTTYLLRSGDTVAVVAARRSADGTTRLVGSAYAPDAPTPFATWSSPTPGFPLPVVQSAAPRALVTSVIGFASGETADQRIDEVDLRTGTIRPGGQLQAALPIVGATITPTGGLVTLGLPSRGNPGRGSDLRAVSRSASAPAWFTRTLPTMAGEIGQVAACGARVLATTSGGYIEVDQTTGGVPFRLVRRLGTQRLLGVVGTRAFVLFLPNATPTVPGTTPVPSPSGPFAVIARDCP